MGAGHHKPKDDSRTTGQRSEVRGQKRALRSERRTTRPRDAGQQACNFLLTGHNGATLTSRCWRADHWTWYFQTQSTESVNVESMSQREQLLQILKQRSVHQGTFTLASGAQSDLYIDARQTTADPKGLILIGQVGWHLVKEIAARFNVQVDSIGGLTLGADAIASSIGIFAHIEDPSAKLQTFVVRKEVKSHGRQKLIEGNFAPGHSVVIVDDVITTGGSTLKAIDAIEAHGGKIAFVIVLVDREEGGRANIEKRGHRVVPIFTRADLTSQDSERSAPTAAV